MKIPRNKKEALDDIRKHYVKLVDAENPELIKQQLCIRYTTSKRLGLSGVASIYKKAFRRIKI